MGKIAFLLNSWENLGGWEGNLYFHSIINSKLGCVEVDRRKSHMISSPYKCYRTYFPTMTFLGQSQLHETCLSSTILKALVPTNNLGKLSARDFTVPDNSSWCFCLLLPSFYTFLFLSYTAFLLSTLQWKNWSKNSLLLKQRSCLL